MPVSPPECQHSNLWHPEQQCPTVGGQSTPHRTEPGEEWNCMIYHETISNGDAFTAAASYASLATASTSHFWSIVPTYETSNVCRIPSEKKTKSQAILTMPVRVVLCPCKALKWEISMWIEILKWLSHEVDWKLFFDQTCWCRAYPRSTGLCLKLPPICLPSGSA